MKLEVGMYVRTIEGYIDEVIDVKYFDNLNTQVSSFLLKNTKGYIEKKEQNLVYDEKGNLTAINKNTFYYYFSPVSLYKASYNIIDLIEVGDYVNGKKVIGLKTDIINKHDIYDEDDVLYTEYSDDYGLWYGFSANEIETIATKESFKNIIYKVEE